ncbi:phenazine-specific anthranilate synthase component I [Longispora fulva]|uniref:anthranilate synthase n=1 Tax=Longispora fulva TaxID=619741 RepID=A0A8J7KUM2_9ACTN|nr:anthranilate synthase family protein [Longispora fulva]MBG6134177.1 phenazine biosynthesis protein phzE [Longispora fulva]GIG62550.1 phenazine-specific anthranilate synthase component I [Longispora fulva]
MPGTEPQPYCLFHANGRTRHATGEVRYTTLLADMPRPTGLPVISMVPFTQLRERGFLLHDGGEPIISLVATECRDVDLDAVLTGPEPTFGLSEVVFDVSDEEFAEKVRLAISEEICRGEGSNFLISRRGQAKIEGFSPEVARVIFRRLVLNEPNAYLTFVFFDGERYFIGSSPERHLTFERDVVTMNPICGTLPKAALTKRADLIEFLTDPKEINELFQVVDEELKMMSRICSEGGVVKGPYLKEMSALIHTEYVLVGHSHMDKVDAFRESMFAATMIGSPLENAARIIHKYEDRSRRYYSSAIVLNGIDDGGEEYLDSAITIRTMEVTTSGDVFVQSGGSVVRDSSPEKETKEVHAKVAGLLRAITSAERSEPRLGLYLDPTVEEILQSRNKYLSRFWTDSQENVAAPAEAPTGSILVVDNEDEFTRMLGHVLTHLGFDVTVRDYDDPALTLAGADLVLVGPGPGDPTDPDDPKMRRVRELVGELLANKTKFLAVCLGHQVVCQMLGMDIVAVDPPLQGVQQSVNLFGRQEPVGFYNTYFAQLPDVAPTGVQIAAEADGRVVALRSENFCTFQFHVESVLTSNCVSILREALTCLQ